jgi:hypothetical protein
MSLRPFKFFQKKPETVFTEWLDQLDDYHLGGIRHVEERPELDETNPRYYDCDGLVFEDVSEIKYDPVNLLPCKHLLYRHIEDGDIVEGRRIYSNHPMWNFPDIL